LAHFDGEFINDLLGDRFTKHVLQRLGSVFERPTIVEKLCQLPQKQAHIANQEVLVSLVYRPPIRENIAHAYGVFDMKQLAGAFC
jgi:hypothetical protein